MKKKTMFVCLVCRQIFGCEIKEAGKIEVKRCEKCKNCEDDKGWDIQYSTCIDCQND
ncbi:MAG: hypothetical protein V3574_04340 [Candidatus Moraniibacteriota bacterium]